jgi:hypothetical protein
MIGHAHGLCKLLLGNPHLPAQKCQLFCFCQVKTKKYIFDVNEKDTTEPAL